jgi:hypothetical protein
MEEVYRRLSLAQLRIAAGRAFADFHTNAADPKPVPAKAGTNYFQPSLWEG